MAERFYVNEPLSPGTFTLSGPEAHHLLHVCRVKAGAKVVLFNGDGHEYPAAVIRTSRTEAELDVFVPRLVNRELSFSLIIACPLPKGDRCQFLLEKLTELGVTSFVPLETERTVVHPGEGKVEKLRRYVIEAAKQCGRNRLMEILPPEKWSSFVSRNDLPPLRWLADPSGKSFSLSSFQAGVAIAIGPEGGWSEKELTMGDEAGWTRIALGARILRMETAALAVAAVVAVPALAGSKPG
jgi:16S rRNA (uracil1498-N3)-methyltransferase